MVKNVFIYCLILSFLVTSCVPTHNFKSNIPYYKLKNRETAGLDKNGYYLSSIRTESNSIIYYKPYFFTEKGLLLSYGIRDNDFQNFQKKLTDEIKNSKKEKIAAWGAYIVEKDTLWMQIISYNSKYNLFVRIPIIEHVFHINGRELEYVYSIDVNLPKPQRFVVKDFNLEFKEYPLKPNIEELII